MPALPGEEALGTTPQPTEVQPVEVAPPAPPGRRGVSPYPLHEPPEGAVNDGERGEERSGGRRYLEGVGSGDVPNSSRGTYWGSHKLPRKTILTELYFFLFYNNLSFY